MRTRSLITTGLWTQLPDTLLATTNIVPTKNTTAQQYSRCSTAGSRGADYEVDSRRSVVSPDSERPEARVTWSVEWPAKGAAAWWGGGGVKRGRVERGHPLARSLPLCPRRRPRHIVGAATLTSSKWDTRLGQHCIDCSFFVQSRGFSQA